MRKGGGSTTPGETSVVIHVSTWVRDKANASNCPCVEVRLSACCILDVSVSTTGSTELISGICDTGAYVATSLFSVCDLLSVDPVVAVCDMPSISNEPLCGCVTQGGSAVADTALPGAVPSPGDCP